jgi:hypothetical protein
MFNIHAKFALQNSTPADWQHLVPWQLQRSNMIQDHGGFNSSDVYTDRWKGHGVRLYVRFTVQ